MLCTGKYNSYHSKSVSVDVPRGTIFCPKCRNTLFWKLVKYRRQIESKKSKQKKEPKIIDGTNYGVLDEHGKA